MLSKTTKKKIDFLLPLAATVGIGFYAHKQGKDYKFVGITAAITFLLLYIVTSQFTRQVLLSGPSAVPTGGGCDDFDPTPYTDAIQDDIYSLFSFRQTQPYKKLLSLADCQVISVWNDWNRRYYDLDQETLRVAMSNEKTGIEFNYLRTQIFNRFDRLKLG